MTPEPHAAARATLQRAMQLHTDDDIDAALAEAARAIELAPDLAEAHAYLGNTLVTRKRSFADGLITLERAAQLAPDDVGILYTLGWCQEFIAQSIMRGGLRARHQPIDRTADDLFEAATATMLRARAICDPADDILGDIEDVLDYIANATGVPWTDEERERAAPRPR